jgi:hypothetical protein
MECVDDLGIKETISKNGNVRNRRFGLFICPECFDKVEVDIYYGKKAKTCVKCRPYHMECKHHMCNTRQYKTWTSMKQRCDNTKCETYKYYGKKGIKYDVSWSDFNEFWKDMSPTYFDSGSIDRIDNNGDYCKENCQWLTFSENAKKDKIKKVMQFEISGKGKNIIYTNCVSTFDSVVEAEVKTGFHRSGIARCARGERRKANGYGWRYVN